MAGRGDQRSQQRTRSDSSPELRPGLPLHGEEIPRRGRARGREPRLRSESSRERRPGLPLRGEEIPPRGRARGREPLLRSRSPSEPSSSFGGPGPSSSFSGPPTLSAPGSSLSGQPSSRRRTPSSSSQQDLANPTWPAAGFSKEGTLGEPTKVVANYIAFNKNPQYILYQYHVKFAPEIESKFIRQAMVYKHECFSGKRILFDGNVLWLFYQLENEITELFSTRLSDGEMIKIEVKFISVVSNHDPIILQILGIQMKKNFVSMNFKAFGKNYFDVQNCISLTDHGLELIPGFSTAIHQYERNILMNCNSSFKFIQDKTVLQTMKDCYKAGGNFREECDKKLLGRVVYAKYSNRTYRIAEIDWNVHPRDTFDRKGQPITFIDYMKQMYNCTVSDPGQPMLVIRPKARDVRRGENRPILLIPEFCTLTDIDEETRSNFSVMRAVASYTRTNPTERVQNLLNFLDSLKKNEKVKREMNEWGLNFASKLQEIQARTFQPEGIIVTSDRNDRGDQYNLREADWSKIIRSKRLLEPTRFASWIVVHTTRDQHIASDFINKMREVCPPMGITVSNPTLILCANDRTQTYVQSLSRHMGEQVQMIVAIIPGDRKELYDAIKKMCCIEFGVPSQVVTRRTLGKENTLKSITTKIAIQMNCKLGGQAWRVNTPVAGIMAVGMDTYHDTTQRNMSVNTVVSSTNDFMTKYHSQASFQPKGQEMSDSLINQIAMGLRRYFEINKQLPEKIIIYRDGVGEGQIDLLKKWELKQVLQAISAQGPNYEPELIFVVVNKRITTRLFKPVGGGGARGGPEARPGPSTSGYSARPSRYGARPGSFTRGYGVRPGDYGVRMGPGPSGRGRSLGYSQGGGQVEGRGERYDNPLPGTVVDSEITRPDRFDFFLVSQSVNQGSITPTYYNVIHTNSNMSVNILQRFTYQLCHLYYNWQGTIRVPAPTQYAHKLAFLVGESLHVIPSDKLADLLYFL